MKKTILFIVLISIGVSAFSQIQRGGVYLGGLLKYETESVENNTVSTNFEAVPRFGAMLSDNVLIAFDAGYRSEEHKNQSITNSSYILVGPVLRYYYKPFDVAGFFLDFQGHYAFGEVKNDTGTAEHNIISGGIIPGAYLQITRKMNLQLSFGGLQISNSTYKNNETGIVTLKDHNNFEFGFNSDFAFGMFFTF